MDLPKTRVQATLPTRTSVKGYPSRYDPRQVQTRLHCQQQATNQRQVWIRLNHWTRHCQRQATNQTRAQYQETFGKPRVSLQSEAKVRVSLNLKCRLSSNYVYMCSGDQSVHRCRSSTCQVGTGCKQKNQTPLLRRIHFI